MFTQFHQLQKISHQELDKYLSKAWFRMGPNIFTCHFICFEGKAYPTIWLRLDLKKHQFKKSHRKIIRRNDERFQVICQKTELTPEKEALYQKHKKRFEGFVSPTLKHSLQGDTKNNIYDTREIAIYDNEKLIGISFFDLGKNSIASILALFDQDYEKYSLGIYTLFKEIEFGKQQNIEFYYPGYVIPGYPKFDYKLRIGDLEFYEESEKIWLNYSKFNEEKTYIYQIKSKLRFFASIFKNHGFEVQEVVYPLFDSYIQHYFYEDFLNAPLFIKIETEKLKNLFFLIEYQVKEKRFQVSLANEFAHFTDYFDSVLDKDPEASCWYFIVKEKILIQHFDPDLILDYLIQTFEKLKSDHQ